LLSRKGLESDTLHEIKPMTHADRPAGICLALLLAARRRQHCDAPVLWVETNQDARELGTLYGPALIRLGLDPKALLLVRTANAADALWAMEEGLASRTLSLVIGLCVTPSATPQRRLSLVCAANDTPCLLVTTHATAGVTAAQTRWRVARRNRSMGQTGDLAAITPTFTVQLERSRSTLLRPPEASPALEIEWCHEARRLRVASALADRASGAEHARLGAG
jgi:protein ImuA